MRKKRKEKEGNIREEKRERRKEEGQTYLAWTVLSLHFEPWCVLSFSRTKKTNNNDKKKYLLGYLFGCQKIFSTVFFGTPLLASPQEKWLTMKQRKEKEMMEKKTPALQRNPRNL